MKSYSFDIELTVMVRSQGLERGTRKAIIPFECDGTTTLADFLDIINGKVNSKMTDMKREGETLDRPRIAIVEKN